MENFIKHSKNDISSWYKVLENIQPLPSKIQPNKKKDPYRFFIVLPLQVWGGIMAGLG